MSEKISFSVVGDNVTVVKTLLVDKLVSDDRKLVLPALSLNPCNKGFAVGAVKLVEIIQRFFPAVDLTATATFTTMDDDKVISQVETPLSTLTTLASLPINVVVRPARGKGKSDGTTPDDYNPFE